MRREPGGGILAFGEGGTHGESDGYSSATNSGVTPRVGQPFEQGLQV